MNCRVKDKGKRLLIKVNLKHDKKSLSPLFKYQATRHSVASMVASSGVSIAIIKEVLGHTDIRTTQKYSHVNVLSQSQVFKAQGESNKRVNKIR